MEKRNFVSLIIGTIGGTLFALSVCMCLFPEWNKFNQDIILGLLDAVLLLIMLEIRHKISGKSAIELNLNQKI